MRILLVYPSQLDAEGCVVKYRKAFLPPLSLATLASLTPHHHSVTIVNDLVEELDLDAPYDLVAITAMTSQARRAYQIADAYRKRGRKVVLGGVHATMLPDEAGRHADAVVVGEAERIWSTVLADCEAGRLKRRYRDEGRPELDELIVPRWDVANFDIYPKRWGSRLPLMPISTTRGCPFACRFCTVTKLAGRTYRMKPIGNVLQEIDSVGAKEYFFVDDNITCNPEYSRELFRAVAGRQVAWMSQISTTVIRHPGLIELAAKSGCFYLLVGMESLSEESLAGANKSFNKVEEYVELIELMRRNGIVPILSFIFGFDEDGLDQFQRTLEFVQKHRVGLAAFWVLTPLPGTDLYDDLAGANRLLTEDWSLFDGTHVVFRPNSLTPDRLEGRYWDMYRRFYSLPRVFRSGWKHICTSRTPVQELFRNVFYQSFFRRKVGAREHPFSGGLGRVQRANSDGSDLQALSRARTCRL